MKEHERTYIEWEVPEEFRQEIEDTMRDKLMELAKKCNCEDCKKIIYLYLMLDTANEKETQKIQ